MKPSIARGILACGAVFHKIVAILPILFVSIAIAFLPLGLGLYFSGVATGLGLLFIILGAMILGVITILGLCMLGEYCFHRANAVVHQATVQPEDPAHTAIVVQVHQEDPVNSAV